MAATPDGTKRTNKARLSHAATQLFPEILQEVIAAKEPAHKLLNDIKNDKYLSKHITKEEQPLVNDVHKNGYGGFDVSLIYKLIRNLKLIPAPSNSKGWDFTGDPAAAEITPGDDLLRIRRFRNKISHKMNIVTKADLDAHFNTFKGIAERLEQFMGRPKGDFVNRFDYLQTCFIDEATEQLYLERLEREKQKNPSDFNQIVLETWKMEDTKFIVTNGAELIKRKLEENLDNFVILYGKPGIGKSATVKHLVLFLQNTMDYEIVYCAKFGPKKILESFKLDRYQVFVFDNLLGTSVLDVNDFKEWNKFKEDVKLVLDQGKTKILASVRLQVFKHDHFSIFKDFKYFSMDLFEENMTSEQQKLDIVKQHNPDRYFEYQRLIQNKDVEKEIDFFPLMFSLNCEVGHELYYLKNPFEYYSKQWDEFKNLNDRTIFSGLLLLVVHNGAIVIDEFLGCQTTREKQTEEAVSEISGKNIDRSEIIRQLETMENVYIKMDNGMLEPLYDTIFDFLISYFGNNMEMVFIKYAHSTIISKRTILESLKAEEQNIDYKVIISTKNEEIFLKRIVNDIYDGNVWDSLGNSQMRNYIFKSKILKRFNALTFEDKRRLSMSRDKSKENEGPLPLYIASFFNLEKIVKFLLEYTEPIAKSKEEPYPALLAACEKGHVKIVEMLLVKGVSVNESDKAGRTPLIVACQNNHKKIVELLTNNSAELEKSDKNGWTPLLWTCALRHEDIVSHIISKNAKVETTCSQGFTPLMWCCIMGKLSLVKLLVRRNANIDFPNKRGKTPLMAACFFRRNEIVSYLLDNHANINHSDNDGWTPLMEACFNNDNGGWNEFLQLEERGLWIFLLRLVVIAEKSYNDNAGYNEMVEILLDRGADVNKCDTDGQTALQYACEARHNRIAHILIERGADVNKGDNVGDTPLLEACYSEDEDVVMPLMEAGDTEIKPIIDQLLDAGADANVTNNDGWNPFFDACEQGKTNIAAKLIKKIRDINKPNNDGFTPLELALQNDHDDIYELFKNKGIADDEKRKRLTEKIKCTVEKRLSEEDNMEDEASNNKELIKACKNGDLLEAKKLIYDDDVDVNYQDDRGRTPLLEACKGNFAEVVSVLLEEGASVNENDDRCRTPLYEACKVGSNVIVQKLLELPLPFMVNKSDDRGFSPLLMACQNGHTDVAELLLDRRADVNVANNAGITPLIAACSKGDDRMVHLLLSKKANVNKSDAYDNTPLMVASYFGHMEIAKMLCSKSADINAEDCQQNTCFNWAFKGNHMNLIAFLIEMDYNVKVSRN